MSASALLPDLAPPQDRLVTLPAGVPDLTLGWEVIAWASNYLKHPNGPRAGERWQFVESQVRFILWWYSVGNDGSWLYHHGARRLSKGSGKSPFAALVALAELCAPVRLKDFDPKLPGGCKGKPVDMPWVQIAATAESQPLALDTVVPTPLGWSTVGDLRTGDHVFGSDGNPTAVTGLTPVLFGEDCYRVTFDDGEEIVASAGHGWTVERSSKHDRRYEEATVSTRDMAEDPPGAMRRYRMRFVPLQLPEIPLPLEPYLLGRWLGDGQKADATIACGLVDKDETEVILKSLMAPWEELSWYPVKVGNWGSFRIRRHPRICRWGHDWSENERDNGSGHVQCGKCILGREKVRVGSPLLTMRERLREAGVLGNKHIPAIYLRASHDQRLSLLQGLIDSDGAVSPKGRSCFTNTNKALIDGFCELLVTLGWKYWAESVPSANAWRVHFTPCDGRPVARLSRKAMRQRLAPGVRDSSQRKYVRTVEPVETVPVRCISVDTPDHLFVAGSRGTLTHNTKNTMRMVRALAPKGSRIVLDFKLDPGKTVYYKAPEGILEVITSSAAAAEGAEASFVVQDETEWYLPGNGGPELASTIEDNLAKSGNRSLETSNAWRPGVGSVAEATYDSWLAQEEGRTRSRSKILYDARIAPPETDLTDEDSLRAGLEFAYGDCWWQKTEPIMARIWDPRSSPDDSKRKYLNWPTVAADAWTTPQDWAQLSDPTVIIGDGDEIVLFFDGSLNNDATALLGCHVETGHVFCVDVWEPQETEDGTRSHVPVDEVDAAVAHSFDRWDVKAFFADVKEWESWTKVTWPERYGDLLEIASVPGGKDPQVIAWDMRSHVYDFTMAAELTLTEIGERAFTHDGDSRVARHIANARNHPNRWGVSISKETRQSPKKIDAAVCVIGARMVRRLYLASSATAPPPKKQPGRVFGFA